MEADEGGGVAEPEQHRDDESDSSSSDEEEEEDSDEDSDSDDDYSDDAGDYEEEEEEPIPTPEEVELEFTYPQDFQGRIWQDVVQGRYYRLLIDPSCLEIESYFFKECYEFLIEIVYPEGQESQLLRIGPHAFEYCLNLQRMNPFPDGLIELGDWSFFGCSKLQGRVSIPSSIQFVRERCFAACGAITSVAFESSTAATKIVVELHMGIFWGCEELRSVRLPNNLTVIPSNCFNGCIYLTGISIPGTVRTIQFRAFDHSALRAVDLPESVITIGAEAYSGCYSLASVTIRSSRNAVQVGRDSFGKCPSLATIKVYPWHFPKIFAAMTDDPSFLYKFFHQYHHQIVDEEAEVGMVTRQHRNGRRRRRQRPPQKQQRLQG